MGAFVLWAWLNNAGTVAPTLPLVIVSASIRADAVIVSGGRSDSVSVTGSVDTNITVTVETD